MQVVSRFRIYGIIIVGLIFYASTHKFIAGLKFGLTNELKPLITSLFFGVFFIGLSFLCIAIGPDGLYLVFGLAKENGEIKGFKRKIEWTEITFTVTHNWIYTTIFLGSGKSPMPLIWGFIQTNPRKFIEYVSKNHPEKLKIL